MIELILNRVYIFIIALVLGYFYNKFIEKYDLNDEMKHAKLIRNYLLNDTDIANSSLPILWIHVPYKINAREWKSFYSRNSKDLNLSYVQLTISSIIRNCGKDFKICMIDDSSFKKLIPEWQHNLEIIGSPLKEKVRLLAKLKLLKYYGGMFVPSSFLCLKSLKQLMQNGCTNNLPFVIEKQNRTLNQLTFIPGLDFFGCNKENSIVCEMVSHQEHLISNDNTNTSNIVGMNEKFLMDLNYKSKLNVVDGGSIGIKDSDLKAVELENLFSRDYISFQNPMFGIYINHDELLKRNSFNWFCNITESEIFDSDIILSKYFVLSNSNFYI
tara:strand:+ start:375 stop:1355 length:981 start_codon:yes stop_codon:yes gene_type:complete